MIEPRETSQVALKIVFGLSLLLVTMDSLEVYFSFEQLSNASRKLESDFFESCVKYHVISQIFFTLFATFAGFSACLMSFCLIINYSFFQAKLIDTFLYWNYLIFGPFLLGSCILSFFYWNDIVYYCDPRFLDVKYFNFSTLMAIVICLVFSLIITLTFSIWNSFHTLIQSVRFRSDGNRVIGRLFWDYVINRESSSNNLNSVNNNSEVRVDDSVNRDRENANNLNENLL